MSGLVEATISGYNKFIKEQQELSAGPGRVTLVLFDNQYEIVYEDEALDKVPELDGRVYYTRGMTALLDAVGKTIARVKERHLTNRPGKTLFLIITDGQENSSQEYTEEGRVKTMVAECTDDLDWEFFYLGANVDAFHEAGGLGIQHAYAANYDPSDIGTKQAYGTVSAAMSDSRKGGPKLSAAQSLSDIMNEQEDDEDSE
jgi:hypothetical protein